MSSRRHPVVGVLLALLGGFFGLHRFYLHDRSAWFYVLLGWTGIPTLIDLVEAFDMPRRVRLCELRRAEAAAEGRRWRRRFSSL